MKTNPSTTVSNGRDSKGRFTKGNRCARGNPFARKVARLRSELLSTIRPSDIKAIIRKLIEKAKAGDTVAAKEIFDRSLGRPLESDIFERVKELEDLIDGLSKTTE